ncbi:MAG: putative hydrolase [Ilumatobacteraceae bacterium]|nr:putative hydrolase [Ilumatobacteraceae bacterium]
MSAPLSISEPTGTPKGGVVVAQEAFGVNGHIVDICDRLAAEGWLAVAPHLFHRSGDPTFGYDDIAKVMPVMQKLQADEVLADVDDALAHLAGAGVPLTATGVVGFCMGGTVALHTATQRDIGAAVTFYGGGVTQGRFGFPAMVDAAAKLRCPWLGLFGDLDTGIPVDEVEALRAAAATSSHVTEIVRYPDAGHGFNCDVRASYHQPSAADAWARTLAWFDTSLQA